jgi:hypothetical protein
MNRRRQDRDIVNIYSLFTRSDHLAPGAFRWPASAPGPSLDPTRPELPNPPGSVSGRPWPTTIRMWMPSTGSPPTRPCHFERREPGRACRRRYLVALQFAEYGLPAQNSCRSCICRPMSTSGSRIFCAATWPSPSCGPPATGWGSLGPTVRQERNAHDLMEDFRSELPLYTGRRGHHGLIKANRSRRRFGHDNLTGSIATWSGRASWEARRWRWSMPGWRMWRD